MCGSLGSRFFSENSGPVEGKDLASQCRGFKQELFLHLGNGMKGRCGLQYAKRKPTPGFVCPLLSFSGDHDY